MDMAPRRAMGRKECNGKCIYRCYTKESFLKELKWDPLKSEWLKRERGVSFEEMIQMPFLGVTENPSRPGQELLVYLFEGYIWIIPCIESEDMFFLKTMYPDRRFQRLWKNGLLNLS